MIVFTNDKKRLLKHCEKDRVLFAYHLGDLDDFYFNDCQWASVYGDRPHIEDLVLIYYGCHTPTVLAFGLSERFDDLMHDVLDILPNRFYCHFQKQSLPLLTTRCTYHPLGTHLKMAVSTFHRVADSAHKQHIRRLTIADEQALVSLYDQQYPGNYFTPRMLQTGKYLGYTIDEELVAAAGVHVDSKHYRVAVLGNIATAETYRGKGIATALTSCLTEELLNEKKLVCLNVRADNAAAISCYQKLGFEPVHEYEEGLFELV